MTRAQFFQTLLALFGVAKAAPAKVEAAKAADPLTDDPYAAYYLLVARGFSNAPVIRGSTDETIIEESLTARQFELWCRHGGIEAW